MELGRNCVNRLLFVCGAVGSCWHCSRAVRGHPLWDSTWHRGVFGELIMCEYHNIVSDDAKCPTCGEQDADLLVWLDDERVQCSTCDTVYYPSSSRWKFPSNGN